jgi:type I restriction enzyme S subunit
MNIITNHLDTWTGAIKAKSSAGRGGGKKQELYGIKKLRELILELAVRGLLVPQDPNDEPASELLKKVQNEKARLVKTGKIKNKKTLPDITNNEKPYRLPASWTWVRLSEIGHDWGQKTPASDFTYIDVGSINKELGLVQEPNGLKAEEAPSRARRIVKNGTVIYSTVRPYLLNIAVVSETIEPEPIASTAFAIVHPFSGILASYIYRYLRSPTFIKYVESCQNGIAYPAINDKQFFNGVFPLPPLAEQHRIVAKVDELMALCDQLEQTQTDHLQAHETLVATLLAALTKAPEPKQFEDAWQRIAAHFDTLFTTEASIEALKQTILQLAVMGKLVEQDSEDEPAENLVKQIELELSAERRKRQGKELTPIREEELRHKTPESWAWKRFRDVAIISSNLVKPDAYLKLPHLAPDNIEKGNGVLLPCRTVEEDKVRSSNHRFYPGQIVYSKIRPNLSKVVIVNFDGLCSADMYPIDALIDSNYLKLYMLSNTFLEQAVKNDTRVAMPKINQNELNAIAVPVPPLAEQHRIVAKVDELMALCDQLKANLKAAQATQLKLADCLVENAIG